MYFLFKSLHIIGFVSWFAGLFYLPRLFVYHVEGLKKRGVVAGSEMDQLFQHQERLLLRAIMNPAMIAAYVFGISMIVIDPLLFKQGGWLHAKIAAVFALSGVHGYFAKSVKSFGRGQYVGSPRYWRMMNEAPTLLMILIVVLAVVKPF